MVNETIKVNGRDYPIQDVMSVEDLANYLSKVTGKCSMKMAYNLVRKKTFPAFKVGNKWFVLTYDFEVWMRKQCVITKR